VKNLISIIGVILLIIGIVGFSYKYFTYNTQENVATIGSLNITAEKQKVVFISPELSGLSIAAGIILVIIGTRRRKS
jgi:hypothetical protein